jgi:hypothetical protein
MMMRIIEMLLLKRKPASGFDPGTMLYNRKSPSAGHSDDETEPPPLVFTSSRLYSVLWRDIFTGLISSVDFPRASYSTSNPGKLCTGNINNICGIVAAPAH